MRTRPGEQAGPVAADQGARRGSARPGRSGHSRGACRYSVATGRSIAEIAAGKGTKTGLAFEQAREQRRNVKARRARGPRPRGDDGAESRARSRRAAAARLLQALRSIDDEEGSTRHGPAARRAAAAISCRRASPRLRAKAPSAADWVHEIKFDGYRIQARLDARQGRAADPQGARLDGKFPDVAAAVAALPAARALIDGEIVVEDERRRSELLGPAGGLSRPGDRDRFVYYVFDLLSSRRPRSDAACR